MSPEHDLEVLAHERAIANHDDAAQTLVGARIGHFHVTNRFHTGQRWQYLAVDTRTGRSTAMRGYELVRVARDARTNGLPVVMPGASWRDE